MKSFKSLASIPKHSPVTKRVTSLVSARLSKSEIELLRQGKKSISDYVQREFHAMLQPRLDKFKKQTG